MAANHQYTPIKGSAKRRPVGGSDSLWHGGDHLLLVENNMYTLSYKRFFYTDIQTLLVRMTKRRTIISVILAIPLILTLLGAWTSGDFGRPVWLFFSAIFLITLLANLIKGPCCKAFVITSVQSQVLPMRRLGKTKKVLSAIEPEITKAQGALSEEALSAANAAHFDLDRHRMDSASGAAEVLDFSYDGRFHLLLFAAMLLMAGFQGVQFLAHTPLLGLVDAVLSLAILVLLIMALVRQNGSAMAGALKKTTWCVLGLILLFAPLAYMETMFAMFGRLQEGLSQIELIFSLFSRNPAEHTSLRYFLFSQIITFCLIAIPGLLQALAFQKERHKIYQ